MKACAVKHCKQQDTELVYGFEGKTHNICLNHWVRHCNDQDQFTLKRKGVFP